MDNFNNYQYLVESGVIIADTENILEQVNSEWKSIFGDDFSVAPGTPQGMLITAEVIARTSVIRHNAALANQINPNEAEGLFLDAVCALTGLERRPAVRSLIENVLITGQPGAIVPGGVTAKTDSGDIFESTRTVLLQADGMARVDFRSVDYGEIGAEKNALNKIVDGVLGLETVLNDINSAITGSTEQSDEALRKLRNNTLALQGISLAEAIISGLCATESVLSVKFRENMTNVPEIFDGITLKPHSIWACVDGGADIDVATILRIAKSNGADYNGAQVVPVVEPASGQVFDVRFDRPTIIPILIKITIRQSDFFGDPQIAVREAVTLYAKDKIERDRGLTVGQSVSPFEIAGAINIYAPGIYVQKIEISKANPVQFSSNEIQLSIFEKAELVESGVQVTSL